MRTRLLSTATTGQTTTFFLALFSTSFHSVASFAPNPPPTTTLGNNLFFRAMSSTDDSSTALQARMRGLEQRVEGPTPTEGGMTLYLKAGEDGVSVGDCPFAHFVRMVLGEKKLEYELRPSTQATKPDWLIESYEGKMPALRHKKECYVDSAVIAEYLEFFFSGDDYPKLNPPPNTESLLDGFFPAVAQYIKMLDNSDTEKLENLNEKLSFLNTHLQDKTFLTGDAFTLLDCRLVPQLYVLYTCIEGYKEGKPDIAAEFPHLNAYYERSTARESFQASVYPKETCLWGWGNARGN